MRFSIIIPVYNVEKYIRKCMDTVMGQTFRDFEVIVVDDESPDNSMRIVEEFAQKYPEQIKMIHQKNTRQGGARNHGVREAAGEYLIFVDSDDYVSLDMLEKVDARLRAEDCDILVFKYCIATPDGRCLQQEGAGSLAAGVYYPQQDTGVLRMNAGPVHKAYRRSFYLESGFRFPEKVLYEDAAVRILYAKASKIVVCDDCLYYYVQTTNSSIRQKPSERMLDILTVTDYVLAGFREAGLDKVFRMELDASLLVSLLFVFNLINKVDWKNPLQDTMADYIRDRFGAFENNPCLSGENKKAIKHILSRNYGYYHVRFLMKLELVERIMAIPVITKLNKIRKQIVRREGNRK